jgi:hypothetical protein
VEKSGDPQASVIEESISLDRCDQVQALNNIAAVELI